jgi:hypothetical protein
MGKYRCLLYHSLIAILYHSPALSLPDTTLKLIAILMHCLHAPLLPYYIMLHFRCPSTPVPHWPTASPPHYHVAPMPIWISTKSLLPDYITVLSYCTSGQLFNYKIFSIRLSHYHIAPLSSCITTKFLLPDYLTTILYHCPAVCITTKSLLLAYVTTILYHCPAVPLLNPYCLTTVSYGHRTSA